MQVFAEILGVPQEDRRHIIELGDRLLGNQDPEYFAAARRPSHRLLPFSSPAAIEMFEFGRKMAAARRKHPGNDIVTQLAFEPLTQREFDVYFVLLATAGNETTRHTITHGLLGAARAPGPDAAAARRPGAVQAGRRGDAALGDARAPLPPHDDARRPSWPARRSPRARRSRPGSSRATATRTSSRTRTRSTSAARRTSTWRSGRAASTTAWARTSRAWRSRSRSRSCSSASPRSSWPASRSGCARTSSTASSGCRCG